METGSGGAGDDRQDVQKKTFGKWLNSQLASVPGPPGKVTTVTDLFYDLRDGLVLLSVLEALTGRKMRRERGNLRVHQLSNVNNLLSLLRENKVKLVNIGTADIVDGNPKITLALVWAVILHWQFHKVLGEGLQHVSNLERSLLEWCRKSAGALGVPVADFTASFQGWVDQSGLKMVLDSIMSFCTGFTFNFGQNLSQFVQKSNIKLNK